MRKSLLSRLGRKTLPYALFLGLAASGYGCAGIVPSPEQVRAMRPKPLEETVQYKSKFEESVIRDSPKGYERDYYAAIWTLFNSRPDKTNKEVLSKLDTLSVVGNKKAVDSLIYFYTWNKLDKQPGEPGISFLVQDLPEIIKWLDAKALVYSNELHLAQYFDAVGVNVLGRGIPVDVRVPDLEKARTTSMGRYNGPGVETWRMMWGESDGTYIFQDDGFGRWKLVSNDIDEQNSGSEKDDFSKIQRALDFAKERIHRDFQRPIHVQNEDKRLDSRSVDVNVLPLFTEDLLSPYALINLGISLDDFVEDNILTARAKYIISREGSDEIAFQDSFYVHAPVSGNTKGLAITLQRLTKIFPIKVGEDKPLKYVLGIDIENGEDKHYKAFRYFFAGVVGNYRGWLVDPGEKPSFFGGRQPTAFDNLSPGDSLYAIIQSPIFNNTLEDSLRHYFDNTPTVENVRLHFLPSPKKFKVTTEPFIKVGPTAKEDSLGDIDLSSLKTSEAGEPNNTRNFGRESGFTITSFVPSGNTLNFIRSYVPNIKQNGLYDVVAEITLPNSNARGYTTIENVYIKNKKK
ncbi:hypothetical protein HY212_03435 [Candidatus Pacearchaeota archaeon]|nr:hypothetical protein [Candidatus Pacearchaeota archaeon]